MQLARDTRATTAVEATPKAFGAAMIYIPQATSLRPASVWQHAFRNNHDFSPESHNL
jgi:predicted SpoU family rRNA methylase